MISFDPGLADPR